ncbi:MAG: hypothetical protein IKY22_05775 [Bacteroidales bacterium]|jgi:hypothetical protein|nr:hypothetical protein [Bacteroidales bacterium]MBR5777950.1 hypothetical protein [Bacteroidales bacterium]
MRKILLLSAVATIALLSSCTKHEYCMCSYSILGKGTTVLQEYHIEDMSCNTFIPEEWRADQITYINPRCEKILD